MSGLEIVYFIVFGVLFVMILIGALLDELSVDDSMGLLWCLAVVMFMTGFGMSIYSSNKTTGTAIYQTAEVLKIQDDGTSLTYYFIDEDNKGKSVSFNDISTYTKYKNGATLKIKTIFKEPNFGPNSTDNEYVVE